tara:strand:+ start:259 stop:864 length:606 start_codon:yes stop_codon:yes gene_type:complete
VTARKRKLLTLQLVLFFIACAFIYFTYYYDKNIPQKQSNNLIENSTTSEKDQNEVMDTNKFKDVTYRGLDLNGNRYEIFAGEADFKIENPELINMKIMSAKFYFKDGTILFVKGDWGVYNNVTNDMKFRDNIEAKYQENFVYADNLDYLNSKNLLNIYKNVRTESPEGNIVADNLKFDLLDKTLDISMFSNDQVNVKIKNK